MFSKMQSFLLFSKTLYLILILFIENCSTVIVKTDNGDVRGYEFVTRSGRKVLVFSGIPYGYPPLGALRFKDPLPPEPWTGIRDVNDSTPCLQFSYSDDSIFGDEDCLQLTVYTPSLNSINLFPVIVYFHGGAFFTGAGQSDHGAQYIMDYNVVVVQVEYRLNAMGFLTLEDRTFPGNMGLKDQSLSLKWVKNNVASFRGDPNRVTLMGDSAGAASVSFHMISPLSRGLFHGAISESGVATAPWASLLPGEGRKLALKTAEYIKCPNETLPVLVDCLQKADPAMILRSFKREVLPMIKSDQMLLFVPVIDNYSADPFLPKSPRLLESASVPWLTGCNNLDGFVLTGHIQEAYPKLNLYKVFNDNFNKLAPLGLFYEFSNKSSVITDKIRDFYFSKQPITDKSFQNLTNMFSDRYFFWPLMESLKAHQGPSYVYNFALNSNMSYQILSLGRKFLNGSVHGDETIFLWNVTYASALRFDSNDLKFSNLLVKLFVNFAIYGSPTPNNSPFKWPTWNSDSQELITVDNDGNFNETTGFYVRRMRFWASLQKLEPNI